mgnify:CR=1 FL=1
MPNSPNTPWVDGLTIGQALEATAARFPGRDAFVFAEPGVRWNWAELEILTRRTARGLAAWGLGRGDHLALWATNVPEWVLLQLAAARLGAVLVNINPAYRPYELAYGLQQSNGRARSLIARLQSSEYFELFAEVCPELANCEPGRLRSEAFPRLERVVAISESPAPGMNGWVELLAAGGEDDDAPLPPHTAELGPLDPINIQYTSGTTGFPKAAMLSHRNLLLNAYFVGACQRLTEQDRIAVPVPFYHCFGCVMGNLAAVASGAAVIVPAPHFAPGPTLAAVDRERATALYGVPTMFIAMLGDPSRAACNLESLRTGIMAGSPCPIEVMRRVVSEMHMSEVTIAYGQTEASPVITQTRTEDPLELRVQTVGRPLPGVEVKIVDPASSAELGENKSGELCARGHGVMLGYYGQPEATSEAIDAEGWLHTGDLALRQADGYYRITGRIKELVIRGGENIYPREIEEFLFTHPAVEQSAVVGVPDPKYGEELCAWIKLRPGSELTEEEVREFCRSKLAHYKTPRYVRFVDAFPQTVTGKIQKFKIREAMIAELGLDEAETA